jgi:tripartite-type tricarboxylate transporter receptor subunit TctC
MHGLTSAVAARRTGGARRSAAAAALTVIACFAPFGATTARAQEYPGKPVRMVLSFPPGGGTDAIARPLAQRMTKSLGQPVIVDHRPGANGIVAMELVARSPADGHTLVLSNVGPIAMNPALYEKLPYDPLKSFAPVTLVATAQYVLLVHPSLPVKSLRDFLALAKKRPGAINYATTGVGSTPHLTGELLKNLAGIDLVSVQYKGGGPALIDLMSGQVSMYFASMPSALPHMKGGRVLALAVSGAKRASAAPELPTVAEAGVAGFDVDGWYGVMAPAGTEAARVNRIAAVIHEALQAPDLREQFKLQGIDVVYGTPDQFAAYIRREIAKWSKVVRASGIKPEA